MKMSQTIGALAAALSQAQGEITGAEKDAKNPFFKSEYATLASVIGALRDPFARHKLAFVQPTRIDGDGMVYVETLILHASGEWLSGEIGAKPVKADPQGVGSLISYLKRYGLQAMVGIPSLDDDANVASGKPVDDRPKLAVNHKPAAVTPPREDLLEIPFGEYPEAVYTEAPSQKKLFAAAAKKLGVIHPVQLATLSKELMGTMVDNLDESLRRLVQEKRETVVRGGEPNQPTRQ